MTTSALITMIAVQLLVTVVTAVFMAKVLRKDHSPEERKPKNPQNEL